MAKKPNNKASKRRNKKMSPNSKFLHITRALNNVTKSLYFTGSSSTKGSKPHNLNRLDMLLKDKDNAIARGLLLDKLRTEETLWEVWVGVFTDDGDAIDCHAHTLKLPECTVYDFDAILTPMIQNFVNEIDESEGCTVVGYGWIATFNTMEDVDLVEDQYMQYFIDNGVLNFEKWQEILASHRSGSQTDLTNKFSASTKKLQNIAEAACEVLSQNPTLTTDEAVDVAVGQQ